MGSNEIDKLVRRRLQEGVRFTDIREEVVSKFGLKRSSAGYVVWRIKREYEGRPVGGTRSGGRQVVKGPFQAGSEHKRLVDILQRLGDVWGFESRESVKLSQIYRSVPTSMADRTVDVLWTVQGHNYPIEVQVHGNIDSLVRRLEAVEPNSKGMIVVGSEDVIDAVKQEIDQQKPKSFVEKMVYFNASDLMSRADCIESLYSYRKAQKI